MSELRLCYSEHKFGNRGIHIQFDNGMVASIQFGHYNYCEQLPNKSDFVEVTAENCEIACFENDTGKWHTKEYDPELCDDVKGYVSTEELPAFLEWCKNYNLKKDS